VKANVPAVQLAFADVTLHVSAERAKRAFLGAGHGLLAALLHFLLMLNVAVVPSLAVSTTFLVQVKKNLAAPQLVPAKNS